MPMTIRQILLKTPPSRRQAADYCKIKEVKAVTKPSTGLVTFKAKTLSTHTPAGLKKSVWQQYVTTIALPPAKGAVVSCTCDDFMFVWEYALAKQGAAKIEYSNGEPPIDTNPQLRPGCCKHIYCLATTLINKNRL